MHLKCLVILQQWWVLPYFSRNETPGFSNDARAKVTLKETSKIQLEICARLKVENLLRSPIELVLGEDIYFFQNSFNFKSKNSYI